MSFTRTIPDTLITYYLAMTSPAQFQPALLEDTGELTVMAMETPDVPFYRFLYDTVGEIYGWRDRRLLTDAELLDAITHVHISVLYARGVPCGYFELERCDGWVQVKYFGLRPEYHGRGLGKHLLSLTIAQAWTMGEPEIRVNTCNLDSDSALTNYLKRGFQIVRTEEEPMPDRYRT